MFSSVSLWKLSANFILNVSSQVWKCYLYYYTCLNECFCSTYWSIVTVRREYIVGFSNNTRKRIGNRFFPLLLGFFSYIFFFLISNKRINHLARRRETYMYILKLNICFPKIQYIFLYVPSPLFWNIYFKKYIYPICFQINLRFIII